jgi:hypothetical protein
MPKEAKSRIKINQKIKDYVAFKFPSPAWEGMNGRG